MESSGVYLLKTPPGPLLLRNLPENLVSKPACGFPHHSGGGGRETVRICLHASLWLQGWVTQQR